MAEASSAKPKRRPDGALLLSFRKVDGEERVKISYRTARGRSTKAVFAANADVEGVLDRWNESGKLDAPDREILNDHSLEGWTAGTMKSDKKRNKPPSPSQRLKDAYKRPSISPKQAPLAKEAEALAAHKDEYRSYWMIIGLVTLLSLMLLGISSGGF
ncbi:MAG: hypothetical protein ABR601_00885 [Parasphingopyxis sp.]